MLIFENFEHFQKVLDYIAIDADFCADMKSAQYLEDVHHVPHLWMVRGMVKHPDIGDYWGLMGINLHYRGNDHYLTQIKRP